MELWNDINGSHSGLTGISALTRSRLKCQASTGVRLRSSPSRQLYTSHSNIFSGERAFGDNPQPEESLFLLHRAATLKEAISLLPHSLSRVAPFSPTVSVSHLSHGLGASLRHLALAFAESREDFLQQLNIRTSCRKV